MLKQLVLENWKSFAAAELEVAPLTVLIGTNASGKSNALDGLAFLSRTAQGKDFQVALAGDPQLVGLRGGLEWAVLKPATEFTLKVLIGTEDDRIDYFYSITVETSPRVQLVAESLDRIRLRARTESNPYRIHLFQTDLADPEQPSIIARLYNGRKGSRKEMHRTTSVLSQLNGLTTLHKEIAPGVEAVLQVLENLFILDPLPSQMRGYSSLSDRLYSDASNIAGVLAALSLEKKGEVESTLSSYAAQLPERDIHRVWAEKVGKFEADAMLYCEERWIPGASPTPIDARGMSDGTLRFLAILMALLTRPRGSQIVIEEVDNGLHPSRSGLLLKMLTDLSDQRQIDVLVTTHNPALLDQLEPEQIPFVVVAHRDLQTGSSKLTALDTLENLPKLIASGPLGKLASQGSIEKSLSAR